MKKKKHKKEPSFISKMIAFFILAGFASFIYEKIAPILFFLIGIVIVVVILNLVIELAEEKKKSVPPAMNLHRLEPPNIHTETIRRQIEILTESADLVNSSNNLDTVLHRYTMVLNILEKIAKYSEADLKAAGYVNTGSLLDTLNFVITNKTTIINQAIERNIVHELDLLKTSNGKLRKLDNLYKKIKSFPGLEPENICFLDTLYNDIRSRITDIRSTNKSSQAVQLESASTYTPAPPEAMPHFIMKTGTYDINVKFVQLSASGSERTCPMCAQFDGKILQEDRAPKLPLCPSCSCTYIYFFSRNELPPEAVISNIDDFVLPSKHTELFYSTQRKAYAEDDADERIRICERQMRKLSEFMEPYISADFPAPDELACRDLLPDLYMQTGRWEKAEKTITACIEAGAYYPDDGSEDLARLKSHKKVAEETLSYIFHHPGVLQRNIYKAMGYEGDEREILKDFLRTSRQLNKVKHNNTYQLFCSEGYTDDGTQKNCKKNRTASDQNNTEPESPWTGEYLYTKWGVYEMPDPYKINLTRGPRNDLKKIRNQP